MEVYLRLGRRRAMWFECRNAFIGQRFGIEKVGAEYIIRLPRIQIVYTPDTTRTA